MDVEQIVGEASDEEPCLVRCKPMAACFVPAEGVLPFLDPVFNFSPAVVNCDYLFRFKIRVGHDESTVAKKFLSS